MKFSASAHYKNLSAKKNTDYILIYYKMMKKTEKTNYNGNILAGKLRAIKKWRKLSEKGIFSLISAEVENDEDRQKIVSEWESGESEPRRRTLISYADLAGVTLEVLLRDELALPAHITEFESDSERSDLLNLDDRNFGEPDNFERAKFVGGRQTRKIAVSFNAGGTGKTTTAVHLAAAIAETGKQVLIVDATNLSDIGDVAAHLGMSREAAPKSLCEFVIDDNTEAVCKVRDNLYLIRGGRGVVDLERKIIDLENKNGTPPARFDCDAVLSRSLSQIEAHFDYIIFDTPSSWTQINISTLMYADEIIIPVCIQSLPVRNLIDYINLNLKEIQHKRQTPLRWSYALPTIYDDRTAHSEELLGNLKKLFSRTIPNNTELSSRYHNTILCDPIRANVRVSESGGHGQTVFEYDKNSNGAADYRRFAERVMTFD